MKKLLFASLFFALPLFGYTVTPASGPAAGGTEVTIDGVSSFWEYDVFFGTVRAASTRRVDADTLIAVTPPHVPASVTVMLWEYDIFVNTAQTFTFTGDVPSAAFERLLLPIFVPPIPGAFGSEFRTELFGVNHGNDSMSIHGLKQECQCVPLFGRDTLRLFANYTLETVGVAYEGKPGRFLYIAANQAKDFSANLRVYDTSRAAENLGTEIPIVRASEFRTTPFALLGMPADPRFRGTLRLYADRSATVTVRFGNTASVVTLHGGATVHDPAYAQLGNVPGGRVIVEPDPNGAAVWGFISVTNNETQHITTITPQAIAPSDDAARERVLLPVFTAPVKGAFGSEFRTELTGVNAGRSELQLFGFDKDCAPIPECIFAEGEFVLRLEPFGTDLKDSRLVPLGDPGYFFYVPRAQAHDLSANLRAYDTSRAAENFGTEIPIVSSDEFRTEAFALTGVPRDPRFRSTLRIYAAEPATVKVTIDDQVSFVTLSGGDARHPAYAQFSNFPVGNGTTRVTIEPAFGAAVWAFISVTNNETQHITTITPRP